MRTASRIVDVWSDNLEEEIEQIRRVVEKYPYVAMVCILQALSLS